MFFWKKWKTPRYIRICIQYGIVQIFVVSWIRTTFHQHWCKKTSDWKHRLRDSRERASQNLKLKRERLKNILFNYCYCLSRAQKSGSVQGASSAWSIHVIVEECGSWWWCAQRISGGAKRSSGKVAVKNGWKSDGPGYTILSLASLWYC